MTPTQKMLDDMRLMKELADQVGKQVADDVARITGVPQSAAVIARNIGMTGPISGFTPAAVRIVGNTFVNSGASAFSNSTAGGLGSTYGARCVPRLLRPDPNVPDIMGWRAWLWHGREQCLASPHQGTLWSQAHLSAETWSDETAVEGVAGIHARLVPRLWKIIGWPDHGSSHGLDDSPRLVTGIVERFGRYVLGTEGWRAEQVVIRELMAPSTEIGLLLEQKYPGVIVHYPDQTEEGATPCESEKSYELESGSRMLFQSLPSSPPARHPFDAAAVSPRTRWIVLPVNPPSVNPSPPDPVVTVTTYPPNGEVIAKESPAAADAEERGASFVWHTIMGVALGFFLPWLILKVLYGG